MTREEIDAIETMPGDESDPMPDDVLNGEGGLKEIFQAVDGSPTRVRLANGDVIRTDSRTATREGYTGTLKDKLGRDQHYVDGKHVSGQKDEAIKWPDHPVTKNIQAGLNVATHLSDEAWDAYARASSRVVGRIPKAGLDRMARNMTEPPVYYETGKQLGMAVVGKMLAKPDLSPENRQRVELMQRQVSSGNARIGGAYSYSRDRAGLHLDGDFEAVTQPGKHGMRVQSAADVYAHEFMHAIDGPDLTYSKSAQWQECFDAEIGKNADRGEGPRLTKYAQEKPSEGLAEFARLVYGDAIPLSQVESEFPACAGFFKERGLWPS